MNFLTSKYENKRVKVTVIERNSSSAVRIYSLKGRVMREDGYIRVGGELVYKSNIVKIEVI